MVILKPGKELPHDCAFFKCHKCECEWVEDTAKISCSEEGFDQFLLIEKVTYIMTCPNCKEKIGTSDVRKIVLENLEDPM